MADHLFSDVELAALYDVLYPPRERDDLNFYLSMIRSARAVLDVGCGTGGLLHMAREDGHKGRLCGLDPAKGMIEQARKRADVEWIEGDLGSVSWTPLFDLAIMTGHAFQVLVEDYEIRAALATVRSAVTDEGCFAFETRNPLARAWENWTPANFKEVADRTGARVRMTTEVDTPFDGRVVSFTHTFASSGWDCPKTSRSTLRFLSQGELWRFLDEAGFVVEAQFGDWDRRRFDATSLEIITMARPRARA